MAFDFQDKSSKGLMVFMKDIFLLDPEITFLNHGSFGACPKPVFSDYQRWQCILEHQPVEFLGRKVLGFLAEARERLGQFLGCSGTDLVYFPNPTTAVNMVVRNLDLKPGDEILSSDHEYGAMNRTWRYYCNKTGARYIQTHVSLPVNSHEEIVESFWKGVTKRTRVIFLSHITSPTALIFPVEQICKRAREAGILSIIDGAHAPGQIDLDLEKIGADIYTGACHKWMMSPKGASFLYARKEVQEWLDPLVVSWGYGSEPGYGSGNQFIDFHEWQGTRDPACFLTVPSSIEFMEKNYWEDVSQECRILAINARRMINALTGLPSICPEEGGWLGQMIGIRLPEVYPKWIQKRLYEDFKIEVPVMSWNGQVITRVSIQAYNTVEDVEKLVSALQDLLSELL
jgi:isopenicillin-N epimerase